MATHVIQFASRTDYGRGMAAIAEVPRTRLGLPNFKMVVEDEHVEALDRAGVPYTDITKDLRNAPAAPLQP
jgi:hypothetical protein